MGIMVASIVGVLRADTLADIFANDKVARDGAAAGSNLVDLKVKIETVRAFLPGFKFLGMGLLFSGIIMALANIINTLRGGGAEVQEAVGVEVKALKKPLAGWLSPRS